MSESTTTASSPTQSTEESSVTATQGDPGETDEGFKSEESKRAVLADLHKEREARKRLQARLDQLEAANMTELERAQKEAADAKAEVEKLPNLVADQLRGYLAGIHSISEEDSALYLTSNDPAVLLKQAAGIATRTTTTPKPDPTQGAQNALALNGDGLTEALARAVGAKP